MLLLTNAVVSQLTRFWEISFCKSVLWDDAFTAKHSSLSLEIQDATLAAVKLKQKHEQLFLSFFFFQWKMHIFKEREVFLTWEVVATIYCVPTV